MELYFRGDSIPTDGIGHLLITDISLHNEQTSTSDEDALFCFSSGNLAELRLLPTEGDWYLDPEVDTTTNRLGYYRPSGVRISTREDNENFAPLNWSRKSVQCWTWGRNTTYVNGYQHRLVGLKRASETAVEGKFTCHIPNDDNNNKFLLILHPSQLYSTVVCECLW